MAYEDRHGVTNIRDASKMTVEERKKEGIYDIFNLSWDYEDDEADKSQREAVILYIPLSTSSEHHHIPMNREEAKIMRDWLDAFLEDTEPE